LSASERIAPKRAALAGVGIDSYRLDRECLRQFGGDPVSGIVILAENDAAMLQPGFSLGSVLR
jgi:hypothetical protein